MRTLLLLILLSLCIPAGNNNARAARNQQDSILTVGVNKAAPFAYKSNGKWKGISIALWEKIAQENKWQFQYREYDLKNLVKAVKNGEVDVTASPLAITSERERFFDFSSPWFYTGIGIATRTEGSSWWSVVTNIFSIEFLQAIGSLTLIILIFGVLLWLFERKRNAGEFGGRSGIGSGFWWSAVTMTTVGYGDKTPKTAGGRIIGLIWMFMGIIIISSFTAAITSSLTINELSTYIESPDDLARVKSGTVKHSSSEKYLQDQGLNYKSYSSVEEALQALRQKKVGAVVYDEPILRYVLRQKIEGKLTVLSQQLQPSFYAFALPENSELKEQLNIELLTRTHESGWRNVLHQYLGKND